MAAVVIVGDSNDEMNLHLGTRQSCFFSLKSSRSRQNLTEFFAPVGKHNVQIATSILSFYFVPFKRDSMETAGSNFVGDSVVVLHCCEQLEFRVDRLASRFAMTNTSSQPWAKWRREAGEQPNQVMSKT